MKELLKSFVYDFLGCSGEDPGFSSEVVAAEYGFAFLMTKPLSKEEKKRFSQENRLFRRKARQAKSFA